MSTTSPTPRSRHGRPPASGAESTSHLEEIWRRAYGARTREDLERLYRDWAASYDEDHEAVGFFGHRTAAAALARYTPFPDVAAVLDAGAGTGAAGQALHELGYRNLWGLDLSAAMLDEARHKGVYRHLARADLGFPLDEYPSSHFDAAIMVGVFSFGQAPAWTLDEILRLVRPGGVVVFTMRVDFFEQDAMGVRSKMEELTRGHAWKLLELSDPAPYLPNKEPDAEFRVWTYRVLETKTPPVDEAFAHAVRDALASDTPVKRIDHAFIWDSTASRLYDRYTECPGYYLTDAEVEILERDAGEILDDERLLVELGCGSARKISCLLEAAVGSRPGEALTYVPVDVSEGAVEATRAEVEARFGDRVRVVPRWGRFDEVLASVPLDEDKLLTFFGGSLGNLETLDETVAFLGTIRDRMAGADRFVVGIDLDKDDRVLHDAYEAGPANRSFFLNMVRRINESLGANFDLGAFRQHSPVEAEPDFHGIRSRCVQLRLVTDRAQEVYVSRLHLDVHLDAGDAIQVGTSRKFRRGRRRPRPPSRPRAPPPAVDRPPRPVLPPTSSSATPGAPPRGDPLRGISRSFRARRRRRDQGRRRRPHRPAEVGAGEDTAGRLLGCRQNSDSQGQPARQADRGAASGSAATTSPPWTRSASGAARLGHPERRPVPALDRGPPTSASSASWRAHQAAGPPEPRASRACSNSSTCPASSRTPLHGAQRRAAAARRRNRALARARPPIPCSWTSLRRPRRSPARPAGVHELGPRSRRPSSS
ncbi:MAG: L-histidine N(alpha)-methyltransferase [Planctomycetota bacterium]